MAAIEELAEASALLEERVMSFPVGAISFNDFKPTDEKISDQRKLLKALNTRLLIRKALNNLQFVPDEPASDVSETINNLNEELANMRINDVAINLCLHNYSIHQILFEDGGSEELQEKIKGLLQRLFALNTTLLKLDQTKKDAMHRELVKRGECRGALFDYKVSMQELQKRREQTFQEQNPEIAKNKQKVKQRLLKINIMKRIMTNMIGASIHMLADQPSFAEMLAKHRDLLSIDDLAEKVRESSSDGS